MSSPALDDLYEKLLAYKLEKQAKQAKELDKPPKEEEYFDHAHNRISPLVHWIRKGSDYRPDKVRDALAKNPADLHQEHFVKHSRWAGSKNEKPLNLFEDDEDEKESEVSDKVVRLVTTPLHEAILSGHLELVKILCEESDEKGTNLNHNPRKGSPRFSKEYSYFPLDLALLPVCPTKRRTLLFKSDIANYLISKGATKENGTVPACISEKELKEMYEFLFRLIQGEHEKAKSKNKKLLIVLLEWHGSRLSLLLECMVLICEKTLGIHHHYMEKNEKNLQCKREFGTIHYSTFTEVLKPVRYCWNEFLTADFALQMSDALNMQAVPVDISPKRETNPDDFDERNIKMIEALKAMNKEGVLIIGASHDGILQEPSFLESDFHALPMNFSPFIENNRNPSYAHDPIVQIPNIFQGSVELWSPGEIVEQAKKLRPSMFSRYHHINECLQPFLGEGREEEFLKIPFEIPSDRARQPKGFFISLVQEYLSPELSDEITHTVSQKPTLD